MVKVKIFININQLLIFFLLLLIDNERTKDIFKLNTNNKTN